MRVNRTHTKRRRSRLRTLRARARARCVYETTHVRIYVFLVRRLYHRRATDQTGIQSQKRERSEREGEREKEIEGKRESKTPRARRTEEGGEGWLEEGVGTSLTVQPTSYALGPTFRRLLSFSASSPLSFILSFSLSLFLSLLSRSLPLSRPYLVILPLPCFYRCLFPFAGGKHCIYFEFLRPVDSRKCRDSFSISRNLVEHERRAFRSSVVEGGKVPMDRAEKNLGFVQVESRRQARASPGSQSN